MNSDLRLGPPETQSDEGVLKGIATWEANVRASIAEGDEEMMNAANQPLRAFVAEAERRGLR